MKSLERMETNMDRCFLTIDDAKKHPDYQNYQNLFLKNANKYINIWEYSTDYVKCSNNLKMNAGRESTLLNISSDQSLFTKITNDGTEQQQCSLLLNKGYVGIE